MTAELSDVDVEILMLMGKQTGKWYELVRLESLLTAAKLQDITRVAARTHISDLTELKYIETVRDAELYLTAMGYYIYAERKVQGFIGLINQVESLIYKSICDDTSIDNIKITDKTGISHVTVDYIFQMMRLTKEIETNGNRILDVTPDGRTIWPITGLSNPFIRRREEKRRSVPKSGHTKKEIYETPGEHVNRSTVFTGVSLAQLSDDEEYVLCLMNHKTNKWCEFMTIDSMLAITEPERSPQDVGHAVELLRLKNFIKFTDNENLQMTSDGYYWYAYSFIEGFEEFKNTVEAYIVKGVPTSNIQVGKALLSTAPSKLINQVTIDYIIDSLNQSHEITLNSSQFTAANGGPIWNILSANSYIRSRHSLDKLMGIGQSFGSGAPMNSARSSTKRIPEVTETAQTSGTIFIGHGRDPVWHELHVFLQNKLHLQPEEFNSQSTAGKSTTARLEEMLNAARFAFLIMTAEDDHGNNSIHARENVVHEVGLFQGRLGFRKAIVILERGCAEFSNISGLTYIPFTKGNFKETFEEIRDVLDREGIK